MKDIGESLVTECECQDVSHKMVFQLQVFKDEESELYLSVQLNPRYRWWRRLGIAFGYALGKRSKYSYGHWDAGSISPESAKGLIALLGRYLSLLNGPTTTGTAGLAGSSWLLGRGDEKASKHP